MAPLISVIIPIYKVERYLKKCVDSILTQNFQDVEVILVDDGSPDNCPLICDNYAAMDSRIRVIHKTNGGLVSARKAGALAASGKYIATVDGDDGVTESFFEKLFEVIQKYEPDIIQFDSVEIRGNVVTECHSFMREGYYSRFEIENEIFPHLIENNMCGYIPPSQNYALILRNIYIECQMAIDDRIRIGEDGACTKPAIYRAQSLYILHECLSIYNINQESMTKGQKAYDLNGPLYVGKQYEKMIDMHQFDFQMQVYRYVTHNLFVCCGTQFFRQLTYREIKKELEHCLSNPFYQKAIHECTFSLNNIKGNLTKYTLQYKLFFMMKLYWALVFRP